jgi:cytochrome c oxidase subunit 3
MSDPASTPAAVEHGHHDDPMSHVPPGSIWPLVTTVGLTILPFGVLWILGPLKNFGAMFDPATPAGFQGAIGTIAVSSLIFLVGLMGWANQIIKEKPLSHDLGAQQKDLQAFILLFLCGELAAFGAVFGFFYHRHFQDPTFGPPHVEGFHFGGALVAYATFILLSSSVTCEFAHHALVKGQVGLARLFYALTILLGIIFLGFMGYEWGEFINRGFYPAKLEGGESAFAAVFYTGTGFHGLHVAIGLIMLCLVLFRLEMGHFKGQRHFAAVAASWYWHFVDIVWVILFITVYVVA